MRNAATTCASSARTDVAAYEDLPSHHLLALQNLIATTSDELYHGSASELPPATSHGYVEWDFSGVPDPVMFQWFLDTADYWFGCSDDSSAGSYDQHTSASWLLSMTRSTTRMGQGLATDTRPKTRGERAPKPRTKCTSHLADGRHGH
jgi:hypothetical protein